MMVTVLGGYFTDGVYVGCMIPARGWGRGKILHRERGQERGWASSRDDASGDGDGDAEKSSPMNGDGDRPHQGTTFNIM